MLDIELYYIQLFGCFIVEQVFGRTRTNSAGRIYSPRDVAEDHIMQDLGIVPSAEMYLKNMRIEPWMSGSIKHNHKPNKLIKLED